MKETTLLFILVVVLGCLGVGAAFVPTISISLDDLVVKEYEATLSTDGILTETFVFDVRDDQEYRMLYRYWEADVVYNSSLSRSYLSVLSVDSPFTSYVKDYSGSVYPD